MWCSLVDKLSPWESFTPRRRINLISTVSDSAIDEMDMDDQMPEFKFSCYYTGMEFTSDPPMEFPEIEYIYEYYYLCGVCKVRLILMILLSSPSPKSKSQIQYSKSRGKGLGLGLTLYNPLTPTTTTHNFSHLKCQSSDGKI